MRSPNDLFPLFRFSMQSLVYGFEGWQMRPDFLHNESIPFKGFAYFICGLTSHPFALSIMNSEKRFVTFTYETWFS